VILIYDNDEKIAPGAATTLVQRGYDNIFMLSGGEHWHFILSTISWMLWCVSVCLGFIILDAMCAWLPCVAYSSADSCVHSNLFDCMLYCSCCHGVFSCTVRKKRRNFILEVDSKPILLTSSSLLHSIHVLYGVWVSSKTWSPMSRFAHGPQFTRGTFQLRGTISLLAGSPDISLCYKLHSSFLACNSRLRSAIRRHHPPQRAVLSQICCFGERKVVFFQILLDGAEPRDAGTT